MFCLLIFQALHPENINFVPLKQVSYAVKCILLFSCFEHIPICTAKVSIGHVIGNPVYNRGI